VDPCGPPAHRRDRWKVQVWTTLPLTTKRPEWPRVKCSPVRGPWVRPRSRYGFTSRRGDRLVHLLRAHGLAMGSVLSNPSWLGFPCGSSVRPHVPVCGRRTSSGSCFGFEILYILCVETTPSTWIRQVTWLGLIPPRGTQSLTIRRAAGVTNIGCESGPGEERLLRLPSRPRVQYLPQIPETQCCPLGLVLKTAWGRNHLAAGQTGLPGSKRSIRF